MVVLLAATTTAVASDPATDVAVVVHPGVQVESIRFGELRRLLFADRVYWSSRLKVTILMPEGRERQVVLKRVYEMTEAQFRQFWLAKLFRAEVTAGPKIVRSDETAIELVNAIPGALTFIDASRVTPGLKVLRIEGRLPGERGYALH